jgi:malate dehydrogenase
MEEIGIIGSGNVGANTAFFIAEKGIANTVLYDVQEGLSEGKALDMMEAAPIRSYAVQLRGTNSREVIKDCSILIITAGGVRKPGMKREDLFSENLPIIREIAADLKGTKAKVVIVTEPVDLMTAAFVRASGLDPKKVMGLGGLLDAVRLKYSLSKKLRVSAENIVTMVIGRHGDRMIPLPSYTRVSGVPVAQLLEPEELKTLFEEIRRAGDVIVDMAVRASSYYGPSAAAADIAEVLQRGTGRILPVSVMLEGQYGVDGLALSLPCVVGSSGIERILEPSLSREEEEAFRSSAGELQEILNKNPSRT